MKGKRRSLSPEDALYETQVNFIEALIEREVDSDFASAEGTAEFLALSRKHRDALRDYFFAGRDIDVDDIFAYRSALEREHPQLAGTAHEALRVFLNLQHISEHDQRGLLYPAEIGR